MISMVVEIIPTRLAKEQAGFIYSSRQAIAHLDAGIRRQGKFLFQIGAMFPGQRVASDAAKRLDCCQRGRHYSPNVIFAAAATRISSTTAINKTPKIDDVIRRF